MKKYNYYIKNLSLFLVFELFIVFICSLLNMFGLSTNITTIILFVLNLSLFFVFAFKNGIKSRKKGYFSGLYTGLFLLTSLYFINLIFFKGSFDINLITYYLILLLTSIFGGMVGKSKKKED